MKSTAAVIAHGSSEAQRSKNKRQRYQQIPSSEPEITKNRRAVAEVDVDTHLVLHRHLKNFQSQNRRRVIIAVLSVIAFVVFLYLAVGDWGQPRTTTCDTVRHGFVCEPEISRFWGQYSPYFEVPSEIPTQVPEGCQITFAQILSRHGARDPTFGKTIKYAELIVRIQNKTTSYSEEYAFLQNYKYHLKSDQLTTFGQQQMVNSGKKYYKRYKGLTRHVTPFIRTSGQTRVIESAQNWTQGFHSARAKDGGSRGNDDYPYDILIIPESPTSNNTLDHSLCSEFETGPTSLIGQQAQTRWLNIFAPPITTRLNNNLQGANLSNEDLISIMDLCPFSTVSSPLGLPSKFCHLFTPSEWKSYDYHQSIGKYYGYSWGNSLAPSQGVGFTNELISRLTNTPVQDHTSTNSTLDSNPKTFPLGGTTVLYADFSHDNDMSTIFAALGLYNDTRPLVTSVKQDINATSGFSASWTVPFAARAYFEKMVCVGSEEELVRVVVNDRVLPLGSCGGDELGRCTLGRFVQSLGFARAGGEWDRCFA